MVKPRYGEISDFRHRLIGYVGEGFLIGASIGSPFHFFRGLRNSPDGGRLAGGVRAVRTNVPRVAGRGGVCMALFGAVETATCLARGRRDDLWNSIPAGAATFAVANARRGVPAATLFALLGVATFAGIAGARWSLELLNNRLFYHFAEVELNRGSPAADPIIECRSKDRVTPDLVAMELNSGIALRMMHEVVVS